MYLCVSSRIFARFILFSHGISFSSDLILFEIHLRLLTLELKDAVGDFEGEEEMENELRRSFSTGRGGERLRYRLLVVVIVVSVSAVVVVVVCSKDLSSGKWRNGVVAVATSLRSGKCINRGGVGAAAALISLKRCSK